MKNYYCWEFAPADPVSPETTQVLRDTMDAMTLLPLERGRAPERATLTFESEKPDFSGCGYCTLDFDAVRPDSLGSGQVVSKDSSIEYVVWAKTESGVVSELDYYGEKLVPFGHISELTSDPGNNERILSRVILPTAAGKVLEINEGEYLGDDEHVVRELGELEVQDLLATMQAVLARQ